MAFDHPSRGVESIIEMRDHYLDYHFKHLLKSNHAELIPEPVYEGDPESSLLWEWSLQPLVMWGTED